MPLLGEGRGYAAAAMVLVAAERVFGWWSGSGFESHTYNRIYREQRAFGHRRRIFYEIARDRAFTRCNSPDKQCRDCLMIGRIAGAFRAGARTYPCGV